MAPDLRQRWKAALDDLEQWVAIMWSKPIINAADMYLTAEKYRILAEIMAENESADADKPQ